MEDERLEDCLRRLVRELGVCYLVLFGSRALGYEGPHSDYDVAVKAGRRLSLRERGLVYSALSRCVSGWLDLVFP